MDKQTSAKILTTIRVQKGKWKLPSRIKILFPFEKCWKVSFIVTDYYCYIHCYQYIISNWTCCKEWTVEFYTDRFLIEIMATLWNLRFDTGLSERVFLCIKVGSMRQTRLKYGNIFFSLFPLKCHMKLCSWNFNYLYSLERNAWSDILKTLYQGL